MNDDSTTPTFDDVRDVSGFLHVLSVRQWSPPRGKAERRVDAKLLTDHPFVSVFGEKSSGLATFAEFVTTTLSARDLKCVEVFVGPPGAGPTPAVPAHGHHVADTAGFRALLDEAPADPVHRVLLMANPERWPRDLRQDVFGELRGRYETRRLNRTSVLMLARRDELFDTQPYSDIADFGLVARLAYVDKARVGAYWSTRWKHTALTAETIERVLDWTGGQPLLVNTLLAALSACVPAAPGGRPSVADAERLGRGLRDNPPGRVWQRWQERLAELCRGSAAIHETMRALSEGQALARPDAAVRDRLLISGWVREVGETIQIRSRCHQAWAREPVRNPARFIAREDAE